MFRFSLLLLLFLLVSGLLLVSWFPASALPGLPTFVVSRRSHTTGGGVIGGGFGAKGFVEGAFRLEGSDWQVVIASRGDVPEPVAVPQIWDSGVRGVFVRFPRGSVLNAAAVERVLSVAVGVSDWAVVRGPDSLQLR